MFRKQNAFYNNLTVSYPIYDLERPFSDYQASCRKIISAHRLDLNHHAELIIEANTPFEFQPRPPHSKIGVLFIHGLLDTPFIMRDLGKALAEAGMLTRGILLPGHGTIPGGLLSATEEEWLQAVRYGIASFRKIVDELFLVGFSIGGALATNILMQSADDFIKGAILLAPAFQINSPFVFLSRFHQSFCKRLQWVTLKEEIDYTKYRSIPLNAVYQCDQLMKKIKAHYPLRASNIPQLFVLGVNDSTVKSKISLEYFSRLNKDNHRMILYTPTRVKTSDARILQRDSRFAEQHITDLSHLCLPVSPTNPHYGKTGDYPFASHVNQDSQTTYGETNLFKNLFDTTNHQRLTFNPDFEFMKDEMIKFIKQ